MSRLLVAGAVAAAGCPPAPQSDRAAAHLAAASAYFLCSWRLYSSALAHSLAACTLSGESLLGSPSSDCARHDRAASGARPVLTEPTKRGL